MSRFIERVCASCGKPGSVMSFRYQHNGAWYRGYYHPKCFEAVKKEAIP